MERVNYSVIFIAIKIPLFRVMVTFGPNFTYRFVIKQFISHRTLNKELCFGITQPLPTAPGETAASYAICPFLTYWILDICFAFSSAAQFYMRRNFLGGLSGEIFNGGKFSVGIFPSEDCFSWIYFCGRVFCGKNAPKGGDFDLKMFHGEEFQV